MRGLMAHCRRITAVAACCFLILPTAAQEKLTREGDWWIGTLSGSDTITLSRLRISTHGRITVRGGGGNGFEYSLTRRVRARSEAEARERLSRAEVQISRQAGWFVVAVSPNSSRADLSVKVPRSLREIAVNTHGGTIDASGVDGSLQIETGGGGIRLEQIGGEVSARTAGGEIVLGTLRGPVRCLSAGGSIRAQEIHGEVWFETGGGEIVVQDARQTVHASTAGGGIRVGKAGGTVIASTAGGSIEVGSAAGMVKADTAGGSIEVGSAVGAYCETGGGPIRLMDISGVLRASTAMGNITARLSTRGKLADSFLSTARGDITVLIPSNTAVTIRAESDTAPGARRIVSDFAAVAVRSEGRRAIAEGEINGGGPVLRLAGAGGTIFIRREE